MKARVIVGLVAIAAILDMSACGDGGGGGAMVSQGPLPQNLDTSQVLAQARVTSETSAPYPINDGALTLTDTSETSEPINVNLM